jgi:hypothetical protein
MINNPKILFSSTNYIKINRMKMSCIKLLIIEMMKLYLIDEIKLNKQILPKI